jgi:hypothetical protein
VHFLSKRVKYGTCGRYFLCLLLILSLPKGQQL